MNARSSDRRGRGEILVVLAMTLLIAAGAAYYALGIYFENAGLRPGITFMGHDLGGLKGDDALDRVRAIIDSTYHAPVYLHYRGNVWILRHPQHYAFRDDAERIVETASKVTRGRSTWTRLLDFLLLRYERKDLAWTPTLDVEDSTRRLSSLLSSSLKSKTFAQPVPEDATSTPAGIATTSVDGSGGTTLPAKVQIITLSGQLGVKRIIETLQSSIRQTPITTRRMIRVDPKEENGFVQVVDLHAPEGGFCHRLAGKTTDFDSLNLPLKTNIEIAATTLHGHIVNPGETFSFNGAVGPRTAARGFQEVPRLVGEKVINEMGRGVSQVASTLYQPVLECGGKVVERYHHIHYVSDVKFCEQGLDVRVVFGSKDFKFINVQDFPLLIHCVAEEGRLTTTLWGTARLPYAYQVKTGRVINEGHETRTRPDPTLAKGLEVIEQVGIDAFKVKVFRHVFTPEGRKVREEIVGTGPDYYLSKPAIIRVGTAAAGSAGLAAPFPAPTEFPDAALPVFPRPAPPVLPDPDELDEDEMDDPLPPGGTPSLPPFPGTTGPNPLPSDVPAPMLDLSFPQ